MPNSSIFLCFVFHTFSWCVQHRGQDGPNKVKSLIQSTHSPQRKTNIVDLAPKLILPTLLFYISSIESQWACLSIWNSSSMTCRSTRTNNLPRIQSRKCGPDGVHTRYLLISPLQKNSSKILFFFCKSLRQSHSIELSRRLETIFDDLDAGTLSFCFGHEFRL